MKRSLWLVIVIIAGFLGYLMGYSFSPFIETGSGGKGGSVQGVPGVDKDMQEYYKKLYEEK